MTFYGYFDREYMGSCGFDRQEEGHLGLQGERKKRRERGRKHDKD